MSKLLGLILIARNGDRLAYPQDPSTYDAIVPSTTTALGEYNSWKLGESIRRIYIGNAADGYNATASFDDYDPATVDFPPFDSETPFDASSFYTQPATLHDPRQIHVAVKAGIEGAVVFDSAVALLQGMYPPTAKNGIALANGSWVQAPLGGYQYVPIETVEPYNDRSLEPWTDCAAFKKHIQEVNTSGALKKIDQEYGWYWNSIKDHVFGLPRTIENIWNVFDFMNSQVQYNQTYAYRLPPDVLPQARALANIHEDAVFGHSNPKHIANLPGRAMVPNLLESLERIANLHDPLQISVVSTTYQSFISLFHLFQMKNEKNGKQLKGIPDFASSILIEVRQSSPPDLRPVIRFAFANSSDSRWDSVNVLDHHDDFIPLTEFIYRVQGAGVDGDLKSWKNVCAGGAKTVSEMAVENFNFVWAFIALLSAFPLFAIMKVLRSKKGAIKLQEENMVEEQEKMLVRSVPVTTYNV